MPAAPRGDSRSPRSVHGKRSEKWGRTRDPQASEQIGICLLFRKQFKSRDIEWISLLMNTILKFFKCILRYFDDVLLEFSLQ